MPDPGRIDATVAQILAIHDGPNLVAALRSAGISPGRLRAATAAGELLVLRRGVVVPRATWESASGGTRHRLALSAALLAYPDGFASHESAAALHGLPQFQPLDGEASVPVVHITRSGAARQEDWLHVHGGVTPLHCVTEVDGLWATDLARTSIELAATRSRRRALATIDAAMRRAIVDDVGSSHVREAVRDPVRVEGARRRWLDATGPYSRHRWVTHVRRAVELADPASESVLESMSRSEVIDSRLPRPRCGVPIRGDDGAIYYADMVWEEFGVIGEADGLSKYVDADALLREKLRHQAIEGAGWRIVRWGWHEGVTEPAIMLGRLRNALGSPTRLGMS